MDDASIVQLFWERSEQAIEETDKKYRKICFRLANNILDHDEDAEECLNDTYMKVWNSIPPEKPDNFKAYICKIVKRLAISRLRYHRADKRSDELNTSFDELQECVSGSNDPEDLCMTNELSKSISKFLMAQKKADRQIFVRRYWYMDSVEEIAVQFNRNPRSVATTLFRLRKKLKVYLQKEGYDI